MSLRANEKSYKGLIMIILVLIIIIALYVAYQLIKNQEDDSSELQSRLAQELQGRVDTLFIKS